MSQKERKLVDSQVESILGFAAAQMREKLAGLDQEAGIRNLIAYARGLLRRDMDHPGACLEAAFHRGGDGALGRVCQPGPSKEPCYMAEDKKGKQK